MIKTIRHEALDSLLIFAERHLRSILGEFFDHYNCQRPHLALGLHSPEPTVALPSGPIVRRQRLNGLINEYSRAA